MGHVIGHSIRSRWAAGISNFEEQLRSSESKVDQAEVEVAQRNIQVPSKHSSPNSTTEANGEDGRSQQSHSFRPLNAANLRLLEFEAFRGHYERADPLFLKWAGDKGDSIFARLNGLASEPSIFSSTASRRRFKNSASELDSSRDGIRSMATETTDLTPVSGIELKPPLHSNEGKDGVVQVQHRHFAKPEENSAPSDVPALNQDSARRETLVALLRRTDGLLERLRHWSSQKATGDSLAVVLSEFENICLYRRKPLVTEAPRTGQPQHNTLSYHFSPYQDKDSQTRKGGNPGKRPNYSRGLNSHNDPRVTYRAPSKPSTEKVLRCPYFFREDTAHVRCLGKKRYIRDLI